MRTARILTAALSALMYLAKASHAQRATDSEGVVAASTAIRDLAAALPGDVTPLASLLRVASREALAARLAASETDRAEGALLRTGRAVDPTLAFTSGIASDLFGNGQRAAVSSAVSGSVGSMWGTDLNVSYLRQEGSGFDPLRQLAAPSTFSVGVSQPLLEGRNDRVGTARAAYRDRSALEFDKRRSLQLVTATVEALYWSLAEAEAVEAVRMYSLRLAEQMLTRSGDLVRLKVSPEADLLTVQSGVALRRAALTEARQQRLDRSDALLFAVYGERAPGVIGRGTLLRTSDVYDTMANDTIAADSALLTLGDSAIIARRPDVLAARERRDAAAVRARLAQNGLRPLVSLEGGWATVNNPTAGPANAALSRSVQGWRAGINVSAPLLNRDDRGRAMMADAEQDAEALRLREMENTARLEVRSSQRGVRLTLERLTLLEDAARLAERQLRAEQRRQELGLTDAFRLLQTEEYSVQARLEAVRARYELRRAEARLRLATGAARGSP